MNILHPTAEPLLHGTFDEMKQKVKDYFNGVGYIYRNSTRRTLAVYDMSNNFKAIAGYVLKQQNKTWYLYKTDEV